jgi:DNA-binding transcriptional LysR family regulator
LDIQQILYVLEVHNSGSISKAAQNLYIAQPNLSNAIKSIEKELGITIFHRTQKGIVTTEEGFEFLQYARSIATRFDAMEKRYFKQRSDDVLSISSMRSSVLMKLVTDYVNREIESGHSINLSFREVPNTQVIQDVITNQADIGIIRANHNSFSHYTQVINDNLLFMMPRPTDCYILLMAKNHPLAKEHEITIQQLDPYTEIYYGDFEPSWYPQLSKIHRPESELESLNTVQVYDRASFIDAVTQIHGAYSMTTTSSHEVLAKYGLIEKKCPGHILESREAAIIKESSLHDPKISTLLPILSTSI